MTIGVLMLHGFSGGPYEIEDFAHYLQGKTDWLIETPTFSGHGDAEHLSMGGYKAEHWLMDAELAYRRLAKKVDEVIVVGFSMGGIIAIHLAMRYPVKKLILLSAAAKYISPLQLVQDLKEITMDALKGELADNELFQRYIYKFQNVPLSSTIEFMKIVRKTEGYIRLVKCPTYIVQGALDGIVPSITGQWLYDEISANVKQLYISECGKHHICFSDDCDIWFEKCLHFLKD